MSRDMVLQSVLFSLAFYRRNPFFFFLKSSLEFNSHRGPPKCIGVQVSSPIDQSFCSVLRQRNNNLQANCTVVVVAVVVVVFFFHIAADIMLNMLPNTLLNNTKQIVKQQKNERKNKARTFTMMLAVGRPTSS